MITLRSALFKTRRGAHRDMSVGGRSMFSTTDFAGLCGRHRSIQPCNSFSNNKNISRMPFPLSSPVYTPAGTRFRIHRSLSRFGSVAGAWQTAAARLNWVGGRQYGASRVQRADDAAPAWYAIVIDTPPLLATPWPTISTIHGQCQFRHFCVTHFN